jgi:hypothetical protein
MPHPDDYDRRDDEYDDRHRDDDHGRRGDDYDRRSDNQDYDDYEEPSGDRRTRTLRRAQDKVRWPAIFLLITGLLCLAWSVMAVVLYWAAPDVILKGNYDLMKQFMPNQPMPPYEEFVKEQQVQQTVIYSFRIIVAILVVIGAMKMKSLQGYGLAMTGTVLSIIPMCSCECCVTMPFGIWALVILLNKDVKYAFSIASHMEPLG